METKNPRLENWFITSGHLIGEIYEDNRFSDGKVIATTLINDIDFNKREVKTLNTTYRLGKKETYGKAEE